MTRYDPFSYGQVQMGGDQKSAAAAPDDILFADHGPTPAADPSWDPPAAGAPVGLAAAMSASDFGDEILGAPPRPAATLPAKPRPAATPRPDVVPDGRPTPSAAVPLRRAGMPRAPAVAPMAKVPPAPGPSPVVVRRPAHVDLGGGLRLGGVLVPALVFAVGGSVAAWLWAFRQNHVLGGIVVGLTLVAAAFTRVFLRR
jgi:hypothetical protein